MNQAVSNTFDIKSVSLDLLALILKTDDLRSLAQALEQRFGQSVDGVHPEGFIVDLEALSDPAALNLQQLLPLLRRHGIRVLGLRHSDPAMARLAQDNDLHYVTETPRTLPEARESAVPPPVAATDKPSLPPLRPAPEAISPATMIISRPVRAGQQIYAKGTNLVVLAMVSAGAEIIADGDIHVYAPLRGRALAGARGNTAARIFARSMEAELVSIAGVYRTLEQALPDSIMHKPTQVFLESERLVMTVLGE